LADHFLQKLAARNDWLTYITPDFLSEEGRPMPYLYLTNEKQPSDNSTGKVRIFIQGHMHGNEPAGEEAVLALLGKMDDNSTWTEEILDKMDLMILPRYNPDGVAYFQRQFATGYDPNRDFMVMQRDQTRHIKELHAGFAAHIFVDCHEYTASTLYGTGEEKHLLKAEDGQIGGPKNLNVREEVRNLQNGLYLDTMTAMMDRRGLRTSPYYVVNAGDELILEEPDSHSRYSDHSFVLSQAIAILTETRGIRLGDQHFQRRTATGLFLLEEILQITADNAEDVYETIEDAREKFAESDEDIIVTDYARETNVTWEFMDVNNGSMIEVPALFLNHTPPIVNITRSRPEAYVFSRAWADVAERLNLMGVKVRKLEKDFSGTVEALTVETLELAASKFEGIAGTSVTTSSAEKNVTIPAGGFWVSTRQVNAAYALVFLEPENVASVATYNIVPVEEGDEFPIFRVPRSS
jgi:hypothetical protein